jgi:putative cell wall-binding protein
VTRVDLRFPIAVRILAIVALVAAAIVAVPAPASAATTLITGRVLTEGETGLEPVANASVTYGGHWSATSNSSGEFSISATTSGAGAFYLLASAYPLAGAYYVSPGVMTPHVASATKFATGSTYGGLDIILVPSGGISGSVEFTASSNYSMLATAYLWDPSAENWQRWSGAGVDETTKSYELLGLPPGDYIVEFSESREFDIYQPADYTSQFNGGVATAQEAALITVVSGGTVPGINATMEPWNPTIFRAAGANRFDTAADVAQSVWDAPVDVVFIASGVNFPDALSAAPVAGLSGGPVLLTAPDSLSAETRAALAALQPARIVIVGGTPSVSNTVRTQLTAYTSGTVERIAGADRFATSRAIAAYGFDEAKWAYLATGLNFPDALSAGPAAAIMNAPVILINGPAGVDAATIALLDELGVENVMIVGGAPAMPESIETQLWNAGFEVGTSSGLSRWETSVNVNSVFSGNNMYRPGQPFSPREFFLATGTNFPDALAGAAAAAYLGVPLYITLPDCVSWNVRNAAVLSRANAWYVLGSTSAVSDVAASMGYCNY